MHNFWLVQRLNKPLDEVDIKEGTPVWRQEPHEKLGEVRRLLFDEQTGRLVALVIRRGFIFSHDVILPARYISELLDDIVRVEIGDRELAQLKAELEALGHPVRVGEFPSGIHAIRVVPGGLQGGADPRREGAVAGK